MLGEDPEMFYGGGAKYCHTYDCVACIGTYVYRYKYVGPWPSEIYKMILLSLNTHCFSVDLFQNF